MENVDFANLSGSSPSRGGSNSASSPTPLTPNSGTDRAAGAGLPAAMTPGFYDLLLSRLQSLLIEIKSRGGGVRLFHRSDGLGVLLEGVRLCPDHHLMNSGRCSMCQPNGLALPPQIESSDDGGEEMETRRAA